MICILQERIEDFETMYEAINNYTITLEQENQQLKNDNAVMKAGLIEIRDKQLDLYKSVIDEIEKIIKECKMLFPHEYSWDEQTDLILTKIANIKESK